MTMLLPLPRRAAGWPRLTRPQACALALLAALALALPLLPARPAATPAPPTASGQRPQLPLLADLPLPLQYAISAALGADSPAYQIRPAPAGGFALTNAPAGMSARIVGPGLRVRAGDAVWQLALAGWGRAAALAAPVPSAGPRLAANRLEQPMGDLSAWYQSGPLGIQQGWTIARRPAGAGPLALALALGGDLRAAVAPGGRGLELRDPAGALALRYGGLLAYDAEGRALPAGFVAGPDGRVTIMVDDRAAAYPLTIDPLVQRARLDAPNQANNNFFGFAVAISADGNTVVVGAAPRSITLGNPPGAVYVFVKLGSSWANASYSARLTAPSTSSLGASVAVSADGSTIAAGAPYSSRGAAYIYLRPAGGWVDASPSAMLTASDSGKFDALGGAVAISADGATVAAANAPDALTNTVNNGAIYLFVRPPGAPWASMTQTARLSAADGASGGAHGPSLAISADGGTVAAGVAYREAAYIFLRPSGGWADATQTAKLSAADGASGDTLGAAIAISADGATVAAGAPGKPGSGAYRGAIYVFASPPGGWVDIYQTATLTAAAGTDYDYLGDSVAISADGGLVAGAVRRSPGGAIYLFARSSSGWVGTQQAATLRASGVTAGDLLGFSVALSADATTLVAGAPFYGEGSPLPGAAYIFGHPLISVAAAGKLSGAPSSGTFVISSDRPAAQDVAVRFSLGGSASPGTYLVTGAQLSGASGSAVIPAGTTSISLTINPAAGIIPGRTVDISLAPDGGYDLGAPAAASLAVLPVVTVSASGSPARFGQITGTLTLTRTGDVSAPLSVAFSLGGSAAKDVDYTLTGPAGFSAGAGGGTLTFSPNVRSVSLTMTPTERSVAGQSVALTILDGADYVPGAPLSAGLTIDGAPPPDWLVLLYMAGDDVAPGTGQPSLTDSLGPLLRRLPYNPNMRLVALYDGNRPGDAAIYVREQAGLRDATAEARKAWPDGFPSDNEFDTGSITTLQSFIAWARAAYPGSPHTMLSIIDHGGGWSPDADAPAQPNGIGIGQASDSRGLSIDAPTGHSLSSRDTSAALAGLGSLGRFDVIFFDACLMGMLESAYEIAPYAAYLVAGENLLWSDFPYERYFDPSRLTRNTSPSDLARLIVQEYNEPLALDQSGQAAEPFAIAAIDTGQLADLALKTEQMARDLRTQLPGAESAIRTAYAQAQKFDYDVTYRIDPADGYVDLADLAQKLVRQSISADVTRSAQAVADAITQRAVIAKKVVSGLFRGLAEWDLAGANGLAIYMPLGERDCRPTGLLRTQVQSPAKPPCTAPLSGVTYDRQVEWQLGYYARPQQLQLTADAPAWAALLVQLDPGTPARTRGPYGQPSPVAPATRIYLPIIANNAIAVPPDAPNLTIAAIDVLPASPSVGQAAEVRVTIRNSGRSPVVAPFWVDLYVDPLVPPTVNTLWPQLASTGASWRVYGLGAGESRVLSTLAPNDPQRPGQNYSDFSAFVAAGQRQIYALVDSYAPADARGRVAELREDDNRLGPVAVAVQPMGSSATARLEATALDPRAER